MTLRNGVRYKMKLILNDGTETEDFINVIVVDSHTNEVFQMIQSLKYDRYSL